MANKIKSDVHQLSKHRLEALTDGIFAFAMTLLILSFSLPTAIKGSVGEDLNAILFSQHDRFLNYFLSFMLLTLFWLVNQQMFNHIKKTDHRHIWLNAGMLMFIVFIPFTTSLICEYPDQKATEFLFASNIFIIEMMLGLSWFYASYKRRLVFSAASEEHIKRTRRGVVIPMIALGAMIMALIEPRYCTYLYLSIPVLMMLPIFK